MIRAKRTIQPALKRAQQHLPRRSPGALAIACIALGGLLAGAAASLGADAPKPPAPTSIKRIPPAGIEVPPEKRAELERDLAAFTNEFDELTKSSKPYPDETLADLRIYTKAVRTALAENEFFVQADIDAASELLREARSRLKSIGPRHVPYYLTDRGLVVRGYVSRLDGSVQPYGLVIPNSYTAAGDQKYRLDVWFHGRNDKLSELAFLRDRRKNAGTFTPRDTIVLHPYGRYCNANKFAGEVDVFEAIESVRKRYRIDDDRIVIRGFSMGGASTWHLAVHFPDRWAAANPGAGFAETPKFSTAFHGQTLSPTWWETKLFHLYDCTDWAENLWHCPVVAYSGEIDKQKQAADVMAQAMANYGLGLIHVIGPKTAHKYEPRARDEVDRRIAVLAEKGRDPLPESVRFATYTLRYNRCAWITVDALDDHWQRARIEAHPDEDGGISILAEKVKAFTIAVPPGHAPVRASTSKAIPVRFVPSPGDRSGREPQVLPVATLTGSDRSWTASFHRGSVGWVAGPLPSSGLRKKHGLQGPIDDAFLEAFLFVRPTGKPVQPEIDAWAKREMDRAITEWRRQFRGEPRLMDDKDVTPAEIDSMNLVLWGDAGSNGLLARIAERLPIRVQANDLTVGDRRFEAAHHAPILIYPNPLNPDRYVVINSGFTFREHAYLSNAYQVPKLPDWAVVDIRTPPDAHWPGKIAAADFFDEEWRLKPPRENP